MLSAGSIAHSLTQLLKLTLMTSRLSGEISHGIPYNSMLSLLYRISATCQARFTERDSDKMTSWSAR